MNEQTAKDKIIIGNFTNVILGIIAPTARRLMCDISPCGGGRCFFTITASGEMIPCGEFIGIDGFSGGNIFKDSIARAMQSKGFKKIRERFVENIPECDTCIFRNICGAPCPAELHSLGNMYEKAIFCEFYKEIIRYAFRLIAEGKEKDLLRQDSLANLEYSYRMNSSKAFVSWSGGKESALACYRARKDPDIEVSYLLNMASEDGTHSRSHGIRSKLLKAQAEAVGVSILQRKTTWETYEREFKKAVSDMDVAAGVFGDIDVVGHRDWVERVCKETGIRPILPLWKGEREDLIDEFIQAGFKAIVVACKSELLGKEWLAREINKEFIEDLKKHGNVDLCGENGEYHTFVYDGPIFKKPVEFIVGEKILRDNRWFLELERW